MFKTVEEIYDHIGNVMFNTLPDKWTVAWLDVYLDLSSGMVSVTPLYLQSSGDHNPLYFDVTVGDNPYFEVAFPELHELLERTSTENSWNKCRFILQTDGSFELEFKFDADLDWVLGLTPDEEAQLDDDLDFAIRQWPGLKEDAYRPWLDPEHPLYNKN
jgi:hypothetical protein